MSLLDDDAFTGPVPDPPCNDCTARRSDACADASFECGEFGAYAEFYRKPRTINRRQVQPEPGEIWRRLAMMTTAQGTEEPQVRKTERVDRRKISRATKF